MIIETYTCDKCKKPMTDSSYGMFVLSHESIAGKPCMGDNRLHREKHFCKDCFEIHFVPILTPEEITEQK